MRCAGFTRGLTRVRSPGRAELLQNGRVGDGRAGPGGLCRSSGARDAPAARPEGARGGLAARVRAVSDEEGRRQRASKGTS